MYNNLKKILVMITTLFITVTGVFFIKNYQNEMFGGYREVVAIEQSTVDFKEDLEKIAKESNSLIAKRIVHTKNNFSGELENTFVPIGDGKLPSILPLQINKDIVKNSSNNTLYVIVDGPLNAENLANQLNSLNNKASVFSTNYTFVLLRLFFSVPQSFMIVIVLLISFASLVLAEYISSIRSIGIRRLAGEGKHTIALKKTYKDSLFLCIYILTVFLGVATVLKFYNIFSASAFLIIIFPILCWSFLLLILNFFLSNVFYYILQSQPINLSIKGKAPMKPIFIIVLVMQVLTLLSLMFSIYGLSDVNNELSLLQKGQKAWSKHSNLFQMSSLDDGGTVTKEQKKIFYDKLSDSVSMIFVNNNLDSIALSSSPLKNSYFPTPEQVSNVLYVNNSFIKSSSLQLSKKLQQQIDNLEPFANIILIPENQKNNYNDLKKEWIYTIQQDAEGAAEDNGYSDIEIKTSAGMYSNGANLFIYPIFNSGGQLISNESFVHEPIIVVGTPYSNLQMYPDAWNIRVTEPDKVSELIKKENMNQALGSLTNGLFSINEKIQSVKNKKNLLLFSTIISIISSILLLILLNTIYFYQGRKVFFIERLSGKSFLSIHKTYLSVVIISNLVISLICLFVHMKIFIVLTPIIYLLLVTLIFSLQLKREKKANVRYLKGE